MPRDPPDGFDAGAGITVEFGFGRGLAQKVDELEKEADEEELLDIGGAVVAPMGVGMVHGGALLELLELEEKLAGGDA